MKASFRGPFIFILGVTFSGIIFSLHYTRSRDAQDSSNLQESFDPTDLRPPQNLIAKASRIIPTSSPSVAPSTQKPAVPEPVPAVGSEPEPSKVEDVPEEVNEALANCECVSEATGKAYNFCYVDPQNPKSIGKKFDCGHLKFLENLNLVENPGPFVNLSDPVTNENEMVFVSALSDNHFNEGIGSLDALNKFNPNAKYIVYGLNLNPLYASNYKMYKNVEFRPFNTTGYPQYVNQWMTYRFKPLIIAEVMKEYRNIWWMDAHISVKKRNMTKMLVNEIAEKRKNESQPMPSPILFFIHASHSNFATLFPDLLEYFPSNSIPLLKNEQFGAQLGANTFYVARTEYTVETFKWWVLCALDEKCMNPKGAQVYCSFKDNRFDFFANCFRFDQSVLNLLLLNDFQDHHKYWSSIGHIF